MGFELLGLLLLFQSYISPIQTSWSTARSSPSPIFQSYISPIQTTSPGSSSVPPCRHFNPTLVQFKPARGDRDVPDPAPFQSYISPIQTGTTAPFTACKSCRFQSYISPIQTIVTGEVPTLLGKHFNPTLVQFKPSSGYVFTTSTTTFQSYISPIQTGRYGLSGVGRR